MNCYNCRRTLNKKTISKEHIPAQAFYVGYGNEFKKNRITVSACKICNENYSKTDQELRDSIGVTNDIDPLKKEYTRKSVSSILRKKGKNKLHFDISGRVIAVSFDYKDLKKSAIKDFKGLFCYKYKYPLPKEWKIEIVSSFETEIKPKIAANYIEAYLHKDTEWSVSGHEDIFRYKLKTLVPNTESDISDTGDITNAISIASIQEYHKKIGFLVIAARHKELDIMRKKQKMKNLNKPNKKKDIVKQIQRTRSLKRQRNKTKRNI